MLGHMAVRVWRRGGRIQLEILFFKNRCQLSGHQGHAGTVWTRSGAVHGRGLLRQNNAVVGPFETQQQESVGFARDFHGWKHTLVLDCKCATLLE